jgi:hypothetical protein
MTVDPNLYITLSVSGLAGVAMVTAAGLSGWRGWLEFKRQELAGHHASGVQAEPAMPSAASRIEIADLKERIRKLEAIAAGMDL